MARVSVAMDRRRFLGQLTGLALAAGGIASPAHAQDPELDFTHGSRTLHLLRPATGERLALEYMRDGVWTPDAYTRLCWLLRDVQAGQHVRMDPTLIAILDWTQRYLARYGYTQPLHILSGFRTLHTNQGTEGAAKNSLHLYGKAVDFYLPGLSTTYLGKLMAWLSQGGVGIYARRGFVHVDTGSFKIWHK